MKCCRIQCAKLDANSACALVFSACLGLFCPEAPFSSDWSKRVRVVGVCYHGVKPQEATLVLTMSLFHLGKNCSLSKDYSTRKDNYNLIACMCGLNFLYAPFIF